VTRNSDDGESTSPVRVDAWFEARTAAMHLRDLLTAAGLARDFPYLQADVNAFGNGIVNIGRTNPAAALRLAQLLRAARESMGDEAFASHTEEGDH